MPKEIVLLARVRPLKQAMGTRNLRRRLLSAGHSERPQGGYVVAVPGIGPVVMTENRLGLMLQITLFSAEDAHRAMGALERFLDPDEREEFSVTWDQ